MPSESQVLTAQANLSDIDIDYPKQLQETQDAYAQASTPAEKTALRSALDHLTGVNDLLQMPATGAGAAPQGAGAPAADRGVSELLALPAVDNRDAMDRRIEQGTPPAPIEKPSWMSRARQALAAVPPARAALELAQPGVANAFGRAAVSNNPVAGAGDLINLAGNTVPRMFGHAGLGGRTGLPTSEDTSQALARAGWADPSADHPIASSLGGITGGTATPGLIAEQGVVAPVTAAIARRAGAARNVGDAAARAIEETAAQRTARELARNPQPVRPMPVPRADTSIPVDNLPRPVQPVRTPASDLDAQLQGHVAENAQRISDAKTATRAEYDAIPKPAGVDLQEVKDHLNELIPRAGDEAEANSLRRVLNNINRIEAESDTQFDSLDKLRRSIGKQAKFGEALTGYEGIGGKQARDLSQRIGETMKAAHEPYDAYTTKYANLIKEGDTIGDVKGIADALKTPEAVADTIRAIGPDGAKKLDALAVRHVTNELKGKTGAALDKAWTDMGPSLAKLPEARAMGEQMVKASQLDDAVSGIAARAEKSFAAQAKAGAAAQKDAQGLLDKAHGVRQAAADRAQEVAHSYTPYLNNLQVQTNLTKRASTLGKMNDKMLRDGLISGDEHRAFATQIKAANDAVDRDARLTNVSKYVAYALTGSYMLSFGGMHAYQFLTGQ